MVGGQDGSEEAPGRQERLWENGLLQFGPRRNGDSKQARQPPQSQWRLVQPYHAGPLRPLAGLSFGLSVSPRATAFTDLTELEKDGGGGARGTALFPIKAKSLKQYFWL